MDRITLMNLPIPKGSTAWQMMQDEGAKGRAEGKAEAARNMLLEGFDEVVVARLSGLSLEEVAVLRMEIS